MNLFRNLWKTYHLSIDPWFQELHNASHWQFMNLCLQVFSFLRVYLVKWIRRKYSSKYSSQQFHYSWPQNEVSILCTLLSGFGLPLLIEKLTCLKEWLFAALLRICFCRRALLRAILRWFSCLFHLNTLLKSKLWVLNNRYAIETSHLLLSPSMKTGNNGASFLCASSLQLELLWVYLF